jgi:hypothetical protein
MSRRGLRSARKLTGTGSRQQARPQNIVLPVVAALLFYVVDYLPTTAEQWVAENLKNALIINVIFALFNLPVGLLPDALASPLARLEPYRMLILIGLLLILPLVGAQFGLDLSVVSRVVCTVTNEVIAMILWNTGHT